MRYYYNNEKKRIGPVAYLLLVIPILTVLFGDWLFNAAFPWLGIVTAIASVILMAIIIKKLIQWKREERI